MSITAKVFCNTKTQYAGAAGSLQGGEVSFAVDYADGRNKEWAQATPSLTLKMNVNAEAFGAFELGRAYTLTFTPDEG